MDLYVSKLGDGSDGGSWARAFRTIQRALCAVPDDAGGHRLIVRPDTYPEPNLYATHKGAAGRYNELVGDFDGSHGSGTTWVYYAVGDQLTWMNVKRAAYLGSMAAFLREWLRTEGIEESGTAAASPPRSRPTAAPSATE